MTDGTLDKDMVADTTICNMMMRVGADRVDAVVYSIVADGTLIYRSYPLTPPMNGVRGLEEVVYDNPLLLGEFRKAYILVDTPDYMLLPDGMDEASAREAFAALHPAYDGTVCHADMATRNASVAYGLGHDLYGFIHRTFPTAAVVPHIAPLVRYFASKPGRGNSRRMICNFRPSSLDVIVIDGNSLLQANTLSFRAPMDAVYYILACRASHGLDPHGDEVLLSGDQALREEVTPVLRTYISRVMPAIFPPQMFRAGKESMRAPFDLIVSPLCE